MGWKAIVLLSSGICVGLLLLILSCVLSDNYWPLIAILPYSMLPIPALLCTQVDSGIDTESPWKVTGDFLTGAIAVSIFAIPPVMFHVKAIEPLGIALATLANVFILGTGVGYGVYRRNNADPFGNST